MNLQGYRLERLLGRGNLGVVWLALDRRGKRVAVKLIHRPASDRGRQREQAAFDQVRQLSHPHLCTMRACFPEETYLMLVMDLAECSFHDWLVRSRQSSTSTLGPGKLLPLFHQAALGLDYLHSQGVIHKDIKPGNLLIARRKAQVADFGLARQPNPAIAGSISGTPSYMAPEVWRGRPEERSDQYALACSYAEMRLGFTPFPNVADHLETNPSLQGLLEEEARVVNRALAKSPDNRFNSCMGFVQALRQVTSL